MWIAWRIKPNQLKSGLVLWLQFWWEGTKLPTLVLLSIILDSTLEFLRCQGKVQIIPS